MNKFRVNINLLMYFVVNFMIIMVILLFFMVISVNRRLFRYFGSYSGISVIPVILVSRRTDQQQPKSKCLPRKDKGRQCPLQNNNFPFFKSVQPFPKQLLSLYKLGERDKYINPDVFILVQINIGFEIGLNIKV